MDVRAVACETGLTFHADGGLEVLSAGPIDTLIIAGGAGSRMALRDRELIDALRMTAGRARRIASVCTGAFLLAETGLLDGRRVSTHWASCEQLAASYPALIVDPVPSLRAMATSTPRPA